MFQSSAGYSGPCILKMGHHAGTCATSPDMLRSPVVPYCQFHNCIQQETFSLTRMQLGVRYHGLKVWLNQGVFGIEYQTPQNQRFRLQNPSEGRVELFKDRGRAELGF